MFYFTIVLCLITFFVIDVTVFTFTHTILVVTRPVYIFSFYATWLVRIKCYRSDKLAIAYFIQRHIIAFFMSLRENQKD